MGTVFESLGSRCFPLSSHPREALLSPARTEDIGRYVLSVFIDMRNLFVTPKHGCHRVPLASSACPSGCIICESGTNESHIP